MKISSSIYRKAAAAAIVLAAAGTAGVAQARDHVYFSIGANVAPGVSLGVSNGPMYYPPVYAAAPVYYAPAPVYYQPAPVYYGSPVYYQPAPVVTYYGYGRGHHRHHRPHARYAY